MQKLEHQQEKERIAWFQEKLEEAMQIVLKIDMYNSITGSNITKETGISTSEWNAQYLKLDEDVRRLQMMADLYFPDLHRPVRELRGKMNVFWGYQRQFLYVDTEAFVTDHVELIEENKSFQEEARTRAWLDMLKITEEIGGKVWNVRDGLMQIARSLRPST